MSEKKETSFVEDDQYSVEDVLDQTTDKSYSQGQLVLRRFLRHKAAMVALVVLAFIIVLSFTSIGFGPIPGWWDKTYFDRYDLALPGGKPTLQLWPPALGEHPFGQDTIGKDYFALVMRGTQISLFVAFTVGFVATTIGTTIGSVAGYFRGLLESLLMRMTDLFIIIPLLVLAAVFGRTFGSNVPMLALMIGLIGWTGLARLVRAEVLSLREREFVAAARAIGTPAPRIILRHVLPNALGTIVVNSTLLISGAILTETAISFLGFGVRAPDTSLGLLIQTYLNALDTRPWLFWWPGMFILCIALCVNFIGDGLRDAFDPRQTLD
ncbi:ABC transporter permease [Tessaracoccus sp. OH4464_COT-324]|uniref:ABC transporter permease n=1 Tax=Tessaracoccus sp. OH4464_COT-324 TaxID=2491059 RepID=UPI000F62E544|nr:ABC transporter permease [Tessaracoccus sp. OH4464_COT-324]RRD46591.1 ABC transporter permease [Tessaracoccus sp. OH4464_COT-324]